MYMRIVSTINVTSYIFDDVERARTVNLIFFGIRSMKHNTRMDAEILISTELITKLLNKNLQLPYI